MSWSTVLSGKKFWDPLPFEGSCDRDGFETGLANCLIGQLNPGELMIIDPSTFDRAATIPELLEAARCEIWDLPSSSPDLNKMENWRSVQNQYHDIA